MNRWLIFWYDGNNNRVSIIDFGSDQTYGPFGNQDDIVMALYDAMPDDEKFDEGRSILRQDDIMIGGMVRIEGTPDVILDDQHITFDDQHITHIDIVGVRL